MKALFALSPMLTLLLACGSSTQSQSDGGPSDGSSPDGSSVDGTTGDAPSDVTPSDSSGSDGTTTSDAGQDALATQGYACNPDSGSDQVCTCPPSTTCSETCPGSGDRSEER